MPLAPLKDPWQQVPMVDYTQASSNDEVSSKIFQNHMFWHTLFYTLGAINEHLSCLILQCLHYLFNFKDATANSKGENGNTHGLNVKEGLDGGISASEDEETDENKVNIRGYVASPTSSTIKPNDFCTLPW